MPHQDDYAPPLGERIRALEEWQISQDKFANYVVEELKEIKTDIKDGLEKTNTVAFAVGQQKSFLAGISFSFAAVGAGIALIINNITLWFSNGGHHS